MKIKSLLGAAVLVAGTSVPLSSIARDGVVYVGIGAAKSSGGLKSSGTPVSLGYLNTSSTRDFVWGVDLSAEGTMLDSTWGQNKASSQGTSYNLIFGKNVSKLDSSRIDAAILVGMRETTSDCPRSYLGYQCYADAAPDYSYKLNYGAVITWTHTRLMLGIRATGESTQAIVGYKF